MSTMQLVSNSNFSGFFTPLPDPLCFTLCKLTWRFPQGRRHDLVLPLLLFPMWTSQLFWGSVCHANIHNTANKLECQKAKVKRKMEKSLKGMPGKISLIGLPSWGEFHGITDSRWALCQRRFPFRSHSSAQCPLWFRMYWFVLEII